MKIRDFLRFHAAAQTAGNQVWIPRKQLHQRSMQPGCGVYEQGRYRKGSAGRMLSAGMESLDERLRNDCRSSERRGKADLFPGQAVLDCHWFEHAGGIPSPGCRQECL